MPEQPDDGSPDALTVRDTGAEGARSTWDLGASVEVSVQDAPGCRYRELALSHDRRDERNQALPYIHKATGYLVDRYRPPLVEVRRRGGGCEVPSLT